MKCLNCGKELNPGAKFCDECGTKIQINQQDESEKRTELQENNSPEKNESASVIIKANHSKNGLNGFLKDQSKRKYIFIGVAILCLILIIMLELLMGSSDTASNDTAYDNTYDNFGNDEIVTAISPEEIATEKVTVENVGIEVVMLSKKFGGETDGYIELTEASAYVDTLGFACVTVTGIKGDHGVQRSDGTYYYNNPSIPFRAYDANGTVLDSGSLKVDNYENKEKGDVCKGSETTFVEAEKVAKIEIG